MKFHNCEGLKNWEDLEAVKKMVSTFNHTAMNDELDDGLKLIQEISTMFCTTFDVIQRFLKSKERVSLLIENRTVDAHAKVQKCLQSTEQQIDGKDVLYPSLDAIIQCFAPIPHAQTELEAFSTPKFLKVLPMLEDFRQKITLLSSGIATQRDKVVSHERPKMFTYCYVTII